MSITATKRVVSVDELQASVNPWQDDTQHAVDREARRPQVRFGREKGLDWVAPARDPQAYLASTRRRPVVQEKSFVKAEGPWDWVP